MSKRPKAFKGMRNMPTKAQMMKLYGKSPGVAIAILRFYQKVADEMERRERERA